MKIVGGNAMYVIQNGILLKHMGDAQDVVRFL
jgi:hypothetical protein